MYDHLEVISVGGRQNSKAISTRFLFLACSIKHQSRYSEDVIKVKKFKIGRSPGFSEWANLIRWVLNSREISLAGNRRDCLRGDVRDIEECGRLILSLLVFKDSLREKLNSWELPTANSQQGNKDFSCPIAWNWVLPVPSTGASPRASRTPALVTTWFQFSKTLKQRTQGSHLVSRLQLEKLWDNQCCYFKSQNSWWFVITAQKTNTQAYRESITFFQQLIIWNFISRFYIPVLNIYQRINFADILVLSSSPSPFLPPPLWWYYEFNSGRPLR
jgi:hypothetical protein